MKIALIAPTHLPARTANTVQVMKNAEAIVQNGHALKMFVPGNSPEMSWDEIASHYGLSEKIDIQWISRLSLLRSYDYGLKAVRAARKWVADVIFTRHPQAAALASKLNIPTILEAHDIPHGRGGNWLFKQFISGSGAARLVSISQSLLDDLDRAYKIPQRKGFTMIAPDGVDLRRYQNLPAPAESRKQIGLVDSFTVGYTGHLYKGRGAGLILRIAQAIPEINFLLVGGNPDDVARVKAEAEAIGLGNVTLAGFIQNEKLPLFQAAADVLIMPYQTSISSSSGSDIANYLSPMKLFEYLACERPILSSDLPVLREALDDSNAILLPPGDAGAWVQAIAMLQSSPDTSLTLAKNARESAAKYTWNNRVKRIFNTD